MSSFCVASSCLRLTSGGGGGGGGGSSEVGPRGPAAAAPAQAFDDLGMSRVKLPVRVRTICQR
jgi:hypothetical protein